MFFYIIKTSYKRIFHKLVALMVMVVVCITAFSDNLTIKSYAEVTQESIKEKEDQINEAKKDYAEIANLVKKYDRVMRESRVYKEEIMIKGCLSQKKSGSRSVPLCHDYLREFPRSFRSREIKGIIDEK